MTFMFLTAIIITVGIIKIDIETERRIKNDEKEFNMKWGIIEEEG